MITWEKRLLWDDTLFEVLETETDEEAVNGFAPSSHGFVNLVHLGVLKTFCGIGWARTELENQRTFP